MPRFPLFTDNHTYAAEQGRVFVTNDDRIRATEEEWLADEQSFEGLILWKLEHHRRFSEGWFIDKFEELAEEDEPFFYPIRFINPD